MNRTTDLAQSALTHEGVESYFPRWDDDLANGHFDPVAELAAWMDAHPDEWSISDDGVFEFRGRGWDDYVELVTPTVTYSAYWDHDADDVVVVATATHDGLTIAYDDCRDLIVGVDDPDTALDDAGWTVVGSWDHHTAEVRPTT